MEDGDTVVVAHLSAAAALALRDSLGHFARAELGRIVFCLFFPLIDGLRGGICLVGLRSTQRAIRQDGRHTVRYMTVHLCAMWAVVMALGLV